ncbi:MAG: hypothetical protein LBN93_08745 [Candidatus Symbiothrix sp.]|jgi:hypothetical protein|nr:hypothetical protein [Candidatus Symbiothrix sp.]
MEELENLVAELRQLWTKKEVKIKECSNLNSYHSSYLENSKKEIDDFEHGCKTHDKDPFLKTEIIKNFSKRFEEIKSDIEKISC